MSKQLVSEQMDDASGGVAASASQQAADKRVMSLLAELEALALEASPATLLQAAERLRLAATPQGSAASRPATNHNLASDSPVQPRMLPFTAQAGCDDELDDDRARRQRLHRADDNPDRRGGRYDLRGVPRRGGVAVGQRANPLGAEQRVRLPACVVKRTRRLFPNPMCCEGKCDFYARCEKEGTTRASAPQRSRVPSARAYLSGWTCVAYVSKEL